MLPMREGRVNVGLMPCSPFLPPHPPRSTKKGRKQSGIGFVADERRINVGLTRARCSLLVIGNAKSLRVNGNWAGLIYEAMKNR